MFTMRMRQAKKAIKKPSAFAKPFRFCKNTRYGASVLIGLNKKHSKIKGFRQSINGINLKIKYFSFIKYASIIKSELFFCLNSDRLKD